MTRYSVTSQETLDQISRHCPDALSAYLQCVNRCNSDGFVLFTREIVDIVMSDNMRNFRTKIKKLARENLLEWHPFNDGIAVTLAVNNDH